MGKSLKGKELGKGISQRKDGTYQARFTDRYGKRVTIYGKTYSEINKKLRESQYEDDKAINVVSQKMTLDEWYDIWFKAYKSNVRDTTQRVYKTIYSTHVKDKIGYLQLSKINSSVIQILLNEIAYDVRRNDTRKMLKNLFEKAVENNLINSNPVKNTIVKKPKEIKRKKKVRVVSKKDINDLLKFSHDTNNMFYGIMIVGFYTGMRIGEIVGLTWDCIDFDKNTITVDKTLCVYNYKITFHETKTTSGYRVIPMTDIVRNFLLEHQKNKKKINKERYPQKEFESLVFLNRMNVPINTVNVQKALHGFIKKMNKNGYEIQDFNPHDMRHTFATNCIENGMSPKALQKILGHSDIKITLDLYTHVSDKFVKDEMDKIFG